MTTVSTTPADSRDVWYWGKYGPFAKAPWRRPLWIVWGVLLILGAIGVVQRMTQGHLPAGYGSYVPWGLWIAIYFHAIGIAGGSFVIGGLGYVLGVRGLGSPSMLRTVIVLAMAALMPAFMAVWFDLGHMERAHRIFTSPNFTSMMAFNAWMYMAFIIIAAICWFLSLRATSTWLRPLLLLGCLLAIVIPSQSGAFFAVVAVNPFWHSGPFPIIFLTSAVTSGAATLLVVRMALGPEAFRWTVPDARREHDEAIDRLRIVIVVGILLYAVLEWGEFSVALWNPGSHAPAIDLILFGPYWWVFWVVHLGLGVVAPLLLLLTSRRRALWAIGALLVAVTFLATRLNVLIPGQAIPDLDGLQDAFVHPRLSYTYEATSMEYLLGCFLIAVGMAVYFILRRIGAVLAFRLANMSRGDQ